MKLHLRLTALTLLLHVNFLFAQTSEPFVCGTTGEEPNGVFFGPLNEPAYSGSIDPEYLASFEPISFNIFFWIIKPNEGLGDFTVTYESIAENLRVVNEYYKPMGICFVLTGYDYIESDEIYEAATWGEIKSYASPDYVKSDAYNVYLPKNLANANGTISGNGITNYEQNKLAVTQPAFLGIWGHERGNVLAHELGHTMRLIHPWGNNNGSPTTQEHVTRDQSSPHYNALTKGDKVHDTPAMATFRQEALANGVPLDSIVDPDNCTYIGNGTDELGVPFSITPTDVGNVMAGFIAQCASGFSTGQGIKVREYIDSNPNVLFMQALRSENIGVDLYIKDSSDDFGQEPNIVTVDLWNSYDVWIRNQPDYVEQYQSPEYHPTNPNYVYVRVTNRGCDTSTGNEVVKLYWTKASTYAGWDFAWTGNSFPDNGPLIGDQIGTVTIPVLDPGEQAVLQFAWNVPDPAAYSDITEEPWHFCLLARIVAANDPMAVTETGAVAYNTKQNNNVAWKNVTVVDVQPNPGSIPGGLILVGKHASPFNLTFKAGTAEAGKKIFQEAEVSIQLNNVLLQAWERGGRQLTNMVRRGSNTFIITGDNAALKNVIHTTGQIATLNLRFNFLTQEITNKETYIYNVIQTDRVTNEVFGGETYEIRKSPRTLFYAGAGDKQANKNEPVVLSAESINEPALYNWYDSEGNLIYEGADFTISTDVAKQYKLEVIALADGYKDYTDVEVSLKPNAIASISPNPSSDEITVVYKLNHGNSAYLSVTGFYGSNTSNNYILDDEAGSITIDIANYPAGMYTICLISNGEVSDSKTLIKQ